MTASTDPSTRYVLPADAPYLANLAALWAANPTLARAIEAIEETPRLTVEPSRSGPPTVTVQTIDGRAVNLHSKYDPVLEAQKLVDQVPSENCVAFYLLGLGLGYALETLFDHVSDESLLFVFEPDLHMIRAALEHGDLSRVISSGRLYLFTA